MIQPFIIMQKYGGRFRSGLCGAGCAWVAFVGVLWAALLLNPGLTGLYAQAGGKPMGTPSPEGRMLPPGMEQDSSLRLSPEEFLNLVRQYHPVARQAGMLVDGSEARLLSARGFFDPSLYFSSDQKTFDGKLYYSYQNAELKLPTWFGVEFKAGIENNDGNYLNSEATMGQSSYAGISIPLAKNLLMDQRRAMLAQAKLLVSQSQAERQLAINDLLFDAAATYWQWVQQYRVFNLLTNAVAINEKRYNALRITVEQGDRAGVDSAEALTQLLSFKAQQAEAWNNFLGAGYELSNYLWTEDGQPYQMPAAVVPSAKLEETNPYKIQYQPLDDLLAVAGESHPKLQAFKYKMDALEVERRLKLQSLLPTVNLKYNALAEGYQFWKGWNATSLENNYKFGVDIGMPLLLRQGRGDYKGAKIKISATELEIDNTRQVIASKVKQYYADMVNQLQQLRLNEQALAAYQKVFEAEQMKFEMGESNLFMLNSRENKVLESQQKVAMLKTKFFKALYGIQWAAGVLR